MLFPYNLIHVSPSTQQVMIDHRLSDFEVSCASGFVLDSPLRGGLDALSSRPQDIIHLMPCRIPSRFIFFHSNFLGALGTQAPV